VTAALLTGLGLAVLPAEAADQSVSATPSDTFSPASVTVNQGDMVTWTNDGGNHNVYFEDGSFDMPGTPSTSSWTVSRQFDTVGTFSYYCEVHEDEGMTGTVTVLAAGTTPPPPGGGPTPPPPGGGPAPAPDRTKPAVTGFTIKRKRFRVTKAGRPFSFRLSEAASVKVVIARKVRKRYRTRGSLTRRGLEPGKHTIAFKGRVAGRKLAPGSYRATLTATDEAGNRSAPDRVVFRVLGR
jgi:plastocyanin